MQPSHFMVFDEPSDEIRRTSQLLGLAALMISRSRNHISTRVNYLNEIVIPAIKHDMIKFFFDDDGDVVGYVIWASLSEDVESRFLSEGDLRLHISEWNEGRSIWVLDMIVPYGHVRHVLRKLFSENFKRIEVVRYVRFKRDKVFFREAFPSKHGLLAGKK